MIATSDFIIELGECRDVELVGGKGANLGALVRAGFPVPGGFVVGTRAFQHARAAAGGAMPHEIPDDLREEIVAAYRSLGGVAVAVRSSATAEDMAAASMAGQYETFLDVIGEEELLEKVRHCWASIDTPRIRAYLKEHGIDQAQVAMAVVVQKLVPSDVAGVLFTINPNANGRAVHEMLIEASWGLGESVVGGRVQPDVLRVDASNGRILEAVIADKRVTLAAGTRQELAVEDAKRKQACLNEEDVQRLWDLGKRAANHFGKPQDIEWALHDGRLFMLQSRPITTHLEMQAREELIEKMRGQLKGALAAGRGPWALHNLAETLPHPTPLTWSLMRRFMSGEGGFGALYRKVGFVPSPAVCREGFLDLLGGRIYMDAARAPEMFFEAFPFAYDLEELKRSPDASQNPPSLPKGSIRARMQAGRRLAEVSTNLRRLAQDFDRTLREMHYPAMVAYVEKMRLLKTDTYTGAELAALWRAHERYIMDEFAPLSLLPSMICGLVLGELRTFLAEHLWDEDPDALAQLLSAGGLANRTIMADAELHASCTGAGEPDVSAWIAEHGYRGIGEFDLSAKRWREMPEELLAMGRRLAAGSQESPLERHRRTTVEVARRCQQLKAQLPADVASTFEEHLDMVRRYVPFREDGKDFFMRGYELFRITARQIGRRLGIGDDVFFLTADEMLSAVEGTQAETERPPRAIVPPVEMLKLIEGRKRNYRAEEKISLPAVVDEQALQTLGHAPEISQPGSEGVKAFALSSGIARGRVIVLRSPTDAPEHLERGYILVCPSTDPSWTPLFVNAGGLILECGGTLSHGAVVAREMGLAAVVVPDATHRFKDGDEIIVDGSRGWVAFAKDATVSTPDQIARAQQSDPQNVQVAHAMVPPPPGPRDRKAARLRNIFAAIWSVFILAFFLLPPAWVSQPTLVFLDSFLWPLVRYCGKPATVAIVAAGIALVTLLLQRFLTDNHRLLEAKRRAAQLTRQASALPADSPRRKVLQALAAPVQIRTLGAAMVPVGLLLGPMVLPFVWFTARIDPESWNAAPGTKTTVVAYVDANQAQSVSISLPGQAKLPEGTSPSANVPALRPVLEHLLDLYRKSPSAGTWETNLGPDVPPAQAASELQDYLSNGIPPRPVRWVILPDAGYSGRVPVKITAGDGTQVAAALVYGDAAPPEPKIIDGKGAISRIEITYDRPSQERVFWQPFKGTRLAWLHIGWVWVYVIAYLPILFLTRWLLRVA